MNLLESILVGLGDHKGPDPQGWYTAWCPYHADEQGDRPNLRVSSDGFCCHRCGEKGGLRKLASKLGVEVPSNEGDLQTYDYCDEKGSALFQVVRGPGKKFWQRRADGPDRWINGLGAVRRVPYRLRNLVSRPDELAFVVEGEKDCDRLAGLSLLATTNPGGAGKWRKEYGEHLRDRDVVILPDNDDPGRKHAQQVAVALGGVARSVKVLELPGLPPKGDVSDWLNAGHTVEELNELVKTTSEWVQCTESGADGNGDEDDGDGPSENQTLAKQLVERFLSGGPTLFHDQRGEPFAQVSTEDGKKIIPIGSKAFNRLLGMTAYIGMGEAPSGEVLRSAARILESKACFLEPEHDLQNRVAWYKDHIWVDMNGTRAVCVTAKGWSIKNDPPILFRNYAHQKPLPEPLRGGDPREVFRFVNIPNDETRLLFLCWLVTVFVPDIPIAVLVLHGPEGAAKTCTFKIVKRLTDPGRVEVRGPISDLNEYGQVAAQNRILLFDNLTELSERHSDAFCRTVSGEGWSKRTLYSDEDSTVFESRCALGINGINRVAKRPDLLDRALLIPVEAIPDEKRREEGELLAEFDESRSRIFGGILGALSEAMRVHPRLDLKRLPRMADFARWGAACAVALGWKAEDFLDAYGRNVHRQTEAAFEESLVAQVIVQFMEKRNEWTGTHTLLLRELVDVAKGMDINTRWKDWPGAANVLSRRLNQDRKTLEARGILIGGRKSGSSKTITLSKAPRNTVPTVPIVGEGSQAGLGLESRDDTGERRDNTVPDIVPEEPAIRGSQEHEDGRDGRDGVSGTPGRSDAEYEFDERAGIYEQDAGFSKRESETRAKSEILTRGLREPQ